MQVTTKSTATGFALRTKGGKRKAAGEIRFPKQVWQAFAAKEALTNELAYVMTMAPPLILQESVADYATAPPRFLDLYNSCFTEDIPILVEKIPGESSEDLKKRFQEIEHRFQATPTDNLIPPEYNWNPRRVVLPFSYGKDSLLSLATLQSLGCEVIPVNIDNKMHRQDNPAQRKLQEEMANKLGITVHQVGYDMLPLAPPQEEETPEGRLLLAHIHFVYLLAMLPFCTYFQAPTIVLNNEYHNSLNFLQREGYLLPRKVMQSEKTTKNLAALAEGLSHGQITAVNLLGGLGNFAIHRLLHEDFPHLAPYRVNCRQETAEHDRWCHNCPRCARAFLFFLAEGKNPYEHGFSRSMLTETKFDLFSMSKGLVAWEDSYHLFQQQEEHLALFEAMEMGSEAKEPLLKILSQSPFRPPPVNRAMLKQAVFSLHKQPEHSLEKKAAKLYKRLLSGFH